MPTAATALWPRNCSSFGSERIPHALVLVGLGPAFPRLAFLQPSSGDLAGAGANDYYLYVFKTGSNLRIKFGNATNVTSNPAGGTDISPSVPVTPWDEQNQDGLTIIGTQRVAADVAISANVGGPGGLGFAQTYSGAGIEWLYVTAGATPNLCHGTEAQFLAGTVVNSLATSTPGGSLGLFAEGRTILGESGRYQTNNAAFINSGGLGAALIFLAGDRSAAIAMWFTNQTGGLTTFGTAQQWLSFVLGGPQKANAATAGSPGSFAPAGLPIPANLAAMSGTVTASPTTAWTTNQWVVLGDASNAYWNGTAWTAGKAP